MMVCLYMGEINGKRYYLAGICDKEICDNEESCEFYVDYEAVKKKGTWDRFGFGREEEGESNEVGRGLPPKETASFSKITPFPRMTAEHPISSSPQNHYLISKRIR